MLDLTVEIDGDISSLDEALVRFTSTEVLDGENRYHCSRFLCLLIFSFYLLSLCLTVFITLLIFYLGDHNLRPLLNLNKTKGALQHCLLILKRTDSQLHNILFWLLMCGLEIFAMSLKDNYICMCHHTQLHGNHFWILKMMSFSVSWKKRKIMPFLRAIQHGILSLFHYSSIVVMLASRLVTCM